MIDDMVCFGAHINETYEELIKERDRVLRDIRRFERKKPSEFEDIVHPSPDIYYQYNLEYLEALIYAMRKKYEKGCLNEYREKMAEKK